MQGISMAEKTISVAVRPSLHQKQLTNSTHQGVLTLCRLPISSLPSLRVPFLLNLLHRLSPHRRRRYIMGY